MKANGIEKRLPARNTSTFRVFYQRGKQTEDIHKQNIYIYPDLASSCFLFILSLASQAIYLTYWFRFVSTHKFVGAFFSCLVHFFGAFRRSQFQSGSEILFRFRIDLF